MRPRDIDSDTIIEAIEMYGIKEGAKVLGCSRGGLTYQLEQRGIKKPEVTERSARHKENLRQSSLQRYGYGDKEDLLKLLREMGYKLGRRPTHGDLTHPTKWVFAQRFGSWTNALEAAGYARPVKPPPKAKARRKAKKKKQLRKPPLPLIERIYKSITPKLRFAVLKRDNFRCVYCGRSPVAHGVVLHIDHVIPVSKGGLTTYKNLVSSCTDCNLGKGNGD